MAESDSVTLPTAAFWTGLAVVLIGWWDDLPMVMVAGGGICLVAVLFEIFGPDLSEREELALDADELAEDDWNDEQ